MTTTTLLSISREDLRIAFLEWEEAYRRGDTLSHEEVAQMSVEHVAEYSADHLFRLLSRITAAGAAA
jgi:hypothetical protein